MHTGSAESAPAAYEVENVMASIDEKVHTCQKTVVRFEVVVYEESNHAVWEI